MTKLFDYNLTGTGWAEVTFANENQSISFEVSYLSDPLSDLYEGLNRLANSKTDFEKIVFAEEPGEHTLLLTRQDNKELKVEIFWSDEWEEISVIQKPVSNKYIVYSDIDSLENFIEAVCGGTQNLLKRINLKQYENRWHLYEFPIDSFSELKKTVNGC